MLRVRGKGNKYVTSGRYISWQELKRRNPAALKEAPSLDEFIQRGSQVGSAEALEPGAFLKHESRGKPKHAQSSSGNDSWVGGSSQSIYALPPKGNEVHTQTITKNNTVSSPSACKADEEGWYDMPKHSDAKTASRNDRYYATNDTLTAESLDILNRSASNVKLPGKTLRKSRSGLSLSARLGIQEPPRHQGSPTQSDTPHASPIVSPDGSPVTSGRIRPPKISLPKPSLPAEDSVIASPVSQTPVARTPLSASHPPPETPLKHWHKDSNVELVTTPRTEQTMAMRNVAGARGGLLLDPGNGLLPKSLQTPPASAGPSSAAMTPSSSASGRVSAAPPSSSARLQIDDMLSKLRSARTASSTGSSASMWAIKDTNTKSAEKTEPPQESQVNASSVQDAHRADPKTNELESDKRRSMDRSRAEERDSTSVLSESERDSTPLPGKNERDNTRLPTANVIPPTQSGVSTERDITADAPPSIAPDSSSFRDDRREPDDQAYNAKLHENQLYVSSKMVEPTLNPGLSEAEGLAASVDDSRSNVGNETMSSINWADDDDDESLPELPEEWTQSSRPMPTSYTSPLDMEGSTVPRPDIHHEQQAAPPIDDSHRTGKRGSRNKSQGKRNKQDKTVPSSEGHNGIQIAGVAQAQRRNSWRASSSPPSNAHFREPHGKRSSGTSKQVRELFPDAHKSGPTSFGADQQRRQPRDLQGAAAKPHGRPRLDTNNEGTFSRITRGILADNAPQEQKDQTASSRTESKAKSKGGKRPWQRRKPS